MEEQNGAQDDLTFAEEEATDTAKCPNCGGRVIYSPADRAMKCEYCGNLTPLNMDKYGEELSFYDLLQAQNNTWSDETHVFRCENCGAKTVISRKDISKKCPFCGTTNVVQTEELCGLKPNAVLPFTIEKKQACTAAIKWAKKRLFAPRKFKKDLQPEEVSGNYSPAFTFDSFTTTTYRGRLGRHRTKTVRVNGKMVTKTYTEWFPISGTYTATFDDVLVQASDSVRQKDVDKLSPFDTGNSQQYASEFLQGFTASQYSRDGQTCWNDARAAMENQVRYAILAKYHYDTIAYFNMDMRCSDITYKYVLLPVYVGHYSFRKKLYNFFVNGRSGRVTGKAPVSPLRVAIAVLLGLAVVVGVALLCYYCF